MMRHLGIGDKVAVLSLLLATTHLSWTLRAPPGMDPLLLIHNPGCRCYVFSSAKRLHGTFKSPNFPAPYPAQIDCIIYLFRGLPFQIVQLTFVTLDLSPPRIDICFDYVAILPDDLIEVRENTSSTDANTTGSQSDATTVLCGTLAMQTKRTFFSQSSFLTLVFHSTTRAPFEQSTHMTGFQGNFLFLNASNFRVDGDPLPNSVCSYLMRNSATRRLPTGGRIVSPRFPNDYPPNIRCSYTFMGRSDERIVLAVRSLVLSHRDPPTAHNSTSPSCPYSTSPLASFDRVLLHSLPPDRWQESRLMTRICGKTSSFQIISEGPSLLLTFISLPFRPKDVGFMIEYVFVRKSNVTPQVWTTPTPVAFEQGAMKGSVREIFDYLQHSSKFNHLKDAPDEELVQAPANINVLNSDSASLQQGCNAPEVIETVIDSQLAEEGVLTSPHFPELYPKCVNATYYFRGRPGQRVFLKFILLELGDYDRCSESTGQIGDRLDFYDGNSVHMPVQLSVCGSRQSVFRSVGDRQRSLAIASSDNYFTMLFTSDDFVGKFEFGFRLEYRFSALPTWEASNSPQVVSNTSAGTKKERVVYFNYHLQSPTTNPTSGSPPAAGNLYLIIAFYLAIGKH